MSFSKDKNRLKLNREASNDTRLGISNIQKAKTLSVTTLRRVQTTQTSIDENSVASTGASSTSLTWKGSPKRFSAEARDRVRSEVESGATRRRVGTPLPALPPPAQSPQRSARREREPQKLDSLSPTPCQPRKGNSTGSNPPLEGKEPPSSAPRISEPPQAEGVDKLLPLLSLPAAHATEERVQALEISAAEVAEAWYAPKATILHSGSKLFWRIRQTLYYRVYLSEEAGAAVLRSFDGSKREEVANPLVMDRAAILAQAAELETAGFVLEVEPSKPAETDEEKIVAFIINRIEALQETPSGDIKVKIGKRPLDSYDTLDFPPGDVPPGAENIGRGETWEV
mmetsp:Transcript_89358/g.178586  ORF Transcript_89358/g.178586 Transcript_89358/m.178586 type:complete len:341 (+) Transcript_89358:134-1156(+)